MTDSDQPEVPSDPRRPEAPPEGAAPEAPAPGGPAGQVTAPVRATPVEKPKIGAFGRILSVFLSPGAVFADIARKPTVVLALVVLTGVGMGTQAVVASHLDMAATIEARLARSGQQVSDAQMQKILANAGKFKYVGVAGSLVAVPALFALLGLVFWLGVKLMGSDTGYLSVFSTVIHAAIPATVVGGVLTAILASRAGMVSGEALKGLVKSNLGAFLPASAGPVVHTLATSVDVFSIWMLVLLALGLSVVGRIKQSRATFLVVGLWLVYVAGHVGLVAALGHAFGR